MRNIIIFCGHIGSGKDTAAKYFIDNYGYSTTKMAGTAERIGSLKRVVFEIFDLPLDKIEDREFREKPHPNLGGQTPRKALQYFGHETRGFLKNVWVNNTIRHIKTLNNQDFVVSDVRYLNEYGAIINMQDNNTKVYLAAVLNPRTDMTLDIYDDPSEKEIRAIQLEADFTIFNEGTLEEFYEKLQAIHEIISTN